VAAQQLSTSRFLLPRGFESLSLPTLSAYRNPIMPNLITRPKTKRFSIAMATYNGEAYILPQLESLSSQLLLPCELIVCDDASSDNTLAILRAFAKNAPFPVHIYENSQRLGFGDNFLQCTSKCSGEWVALCDQDDVWLPEKLLAASEAIQDSHEADLMLLTHSAQMANADLTSRKGKQLHFRKDKTIGRNGHRGFWVLPGFTCIFRRDLITAFDWKTRPASYDGKYAMQPHDKWICMLSNAIGSVRYIAKPLVFYRRHDAAVTGYYEEGPLHQRITISRTVGAEHYVFLADVARQSADALSKLAQSTTNPVWSHGLERSVLQFDQLASVYSMRAEIYRQKKWLNRLAAFVRLVSRRGYFGSRFYSLGMASCLKDAFCCFRT
jgi:glycosyltransferase involved in cell wall biosynthesis